MKRRALRILIPILIFGILGGFYLTVRGLAVPYVGFEAASLSSVWRGEGFVTVKSYRDVSGMVRRAKFDHFVSPIEGLPGGIVFQQARWKDDKMYLLFRAANVSHTVVVYCADRHSQKFLWKKVLGLDA
jgi:hypothetical protein